MSVKSLILFFCLLGFYPSKSFAQHSTDTANTVIDEPIMPVAVFPGGDKALMKFIRLHLHPIKGANGKRLFITFIVEKDGRLTHFTILRGINGAANNEVIRVMRLSPKWKPVVYNGRSERSWFTVPIVFPK